MTRQTSSANRRSDGRFQNPAGSPVQNASISDFVGFLFQQLFKTKAPDVPESHVVSTAIERLAQQTNPSITWLGHASFLIRMGGKTLLTDPFLSKTAGIAGFGPKRFVPAALSVEQLPFIDVLLISHNHYDHLDYESINKLKDKVDSYFVPLGVGVHLEACRRFLPSAVTRRSSSLIGGRIGLGQA